METSRVLLVVSIFCLTLCFAKHGRDASVCTPVDPGLGDPGPDVKIPAQFYVHTQLIDVKESTTSSLTEYYDKINNRGAVYESLAGVHLKSYFDYKTNELILIYPDDNNKCEVEELSMDDDNNFLMGGKYNNGSVHMFSPARALHFADRGIYKGLETIRGIICDHWQSCQYWPARDTTIDAHWYFSAEQPWVTATGAASVPVRFHAKGIKYEGDVPTDFEETHEYYHFRSGLPKDETLLETPPGVYCANRKIKKPLPQMPYTMSFYTEIVDKNDVIVSTVNEEYDSESKLGRFSYTALPMYNLYNNNPVVDVHDFNTGVSYVTNTVLGNCTVRPIPQIGLDITDVTIHDVRMSSAQHFFDFPSKNYSYSGSRIIRDIDAESWIGVLKGWPSKKSPQSVWEWYFAKDSTKAITAGEVGHATPLQFRVSMPQMQLDYDFNIYAFSKDQPDLTSYDVSKCFLHLKREKIGMSIPLFYQSLVESNVKMFKFYALAAIALQTGVTSLRIQNLDIQLGEDLIFIRFELIDVAPIKGDVVKPMKEVPLDEAVKKLIDALNSNKFEIVIYNGKMPSTIKPLLVTEDVIEYKVMARKTVYTSKSMAALGVVMTIVGILAGCLYSFYRCK